MARIFELITTPWDGETPRAFDARNEVEPYKECRGMYGCGAMKPRSSFHRNPARKDGLATICKICKREKNHLDYLIYNWWFRYRDTHLDKLVVQARRAARRLKFPALCESCGRRPPTDRHHDNYERPLDVKFWCKPCHADWHEGHIPAHEDGVAPVLKIRPAPAWREAEKRAA
jgi:hypothetical protein